MDLISCLSDSELAAPFFLPKALARCSTVVGIDGQTFRIGWRSSANNEGRDVGCSPSRLESKATRK